MGQCFCTQCSSAKRENFKQITLSRCHETITYKTPKTHAYHSFVAQENYSNTNAQTYIHMLRKTLTPTLEHRYGKNLQQSRSKQNDKTRRKLDTNRCRWNGGDATCGRNKDVQASEWTNAGELSRRKACSKKSRRYVIFQSDVFECAFERATIQSDLVI